MKTAIVSHRFAKLAIAACLVLAGMPVARAQSIPIANASFENPPVQPGTMSGVGIPGWSAFSDSQFGPPLISGVANLQASAFSPPTDGTQVGFLKGKGHLQTAVQATILSVNSVLLFGIDCYALQAKAPANTSFHVQLMAPFFVPAGGDCGPSGSSNHLTVAFGPPEQVGQVNIGIEIRTFDDNSFVFFDNVTLTVVCLDCVSQGFGAFDLAERQTFRHGAICTVTSIFPCVTTLEFIDSHGVLLKQAHLNLRPGESGFLDLPSTAQGREPMVVIPRWFLHQGSATFSLEGSGETDLRTRFFVNWGDGSVSKMGNLDSGPLPITRGDTGRLKVYCDGSVRVEGTLRFASCQADLAFHDLNGRLLKQSRMTLAPGTARFLDLTFEEARSMERRVEIVPSLTVTGGPAVGSFAVLDSATGITITQSGPAAVQSVGR